MKQRIGIISGVFDPIHKGHISLALKAIDQAKLDEVYFLIEPQPRRKTGVTHLAHRIAMTKIALQPYQKLNLLELPDRQFSVIKTLPRLKKRFPETQLAFLMGADFLDHLPEWDNVNVLLGEMELIIATKGKARIQQIKQKLKTLPAESKKLTIVESPFPQISSGQIRQDLLAGKQSKDLLPSLEKYYKQNWLYSAVGSNSS